ncbi:MAG: hypothetical protein KC983_12625, partial [Phycisphaerales bacterium]|nr:hypothetical protein [Phycisphaerales bacterium]
MTGPARGPEMPERFTETVVAASIGCRRCGYLLRGLRATGSCPECNADVWRSGLKAIDDEAGVRQQLSNPRAVGNGLVMVIAAMLLTAVILAGWAAIVRLVVSTSLLDGGVLVVATMIMRQAVPVLGLIALIGIIFLWPRAGARWSLHLGVVPSAVGVALWTLQWWYRLEWTRLVPGYDVWPSEAMRASVETIVQALIVCVILLGLRNVFGAIGQRSVAYRRAKGGRQGLESLIVAILAGTIGSILSILAGHDIVPSPIGATGSVVKWVCVLMVLIGLGYLMVNAWWIRQEIRAPRPGLDDVCKVPLPDQTVIEEPE